MIQNDILSYLISYTKVILYILTGLKPLKYKAF